MAGGGRSTQGLYWGVDSSCCYMGAVRSSPTKKRPTKTLFSGFGLLEHCGRCWGFTVGSCTRELLLKLVRLSLLPGLVSGGVFDCHYFLSTQRDPPVSPVEWNNKVLHSCPWHLCNVSIHGTCAMYSFSYNVTLVAHIRPYTRARSTLTAVRSLDIVNLHD